MEELQAIFHERNADITLLKEYAKDTKKQEYIEREKSRVQRENWIIKIIKTVKNITPNHKKNIYFTVERMMSYYTPKAGQSLEMSNLEQNFTEELINKFVAFYEECEIGEISTIKKIIRPNNAFIIVDLVKMLVETHRQYFKVKMLEIFKQPSKSIEEKRINAISQSVPTKRKVNVSEVSQIEEVKKQCQFEETDKIKLALYQKYQNFVNSANLNEIFLKDRVNQIYFDLLQKNQTNLFIVKKFQERCHGKPKNFNFNISGLYTQEEMRQIQTKIRNQVHEKKQGIKELRGDCSADQLKEHFKMKVEIQQNFDKLNLGKPNCVKVNDWLPIIVSRCGNHYYPLSITVSFNKDSIPVEQFSQRCGISLKNFLKIELKNSRPKNSIKSEMKLQKRYLYLDINLARTKQLMSDQHRVYSKDKKESIFPLLRSNELRQQSEIALKNRSASECKLVPIFQNELISRKMEMETGIYDEMERQEPASANLKYNRKSPRLASGIEDRTNIGNMLQGRSRIDSIIQQILSQRNMTVNR